MAKIKVPQKVDNTETWEDLRRFVAQVLDGIVSEINGRLQFTANCQATLTSITFTATGTDTQIDHGLEAVPAGWMLVSPQASMVVHQSADPTVKTLTLQSTALGSAKILAFK